MRHIAIDPAGIKAGKMSVLFDGEEFFTFDSSDLADVDLELLEQTCGEDIHLILEEGWKCPDLASARQRIEDAALRLDMHVHRVMPRTWQMIYHQHKPPYKGAKPKSKWYAREIMGLTLPKDNADDYSDAACMYQWYKLKLEKETQT